MLPNALAFGFSEVQPDIEPLKVSLMKSLTDKMLMMLKNLDTDIPIDKMDTRSQFFLSGTSGRRGERESALTVLCKAWDLYDSRQHQLDSDWIDELSAHLARLVDMRVDHVQEWISSNLSRFKTEHANIEELRRAFQIATVDIKANVELCKSKCSACHLSCLLSRRHDPLEPHDCQTSHHCSHYCEFDEEHPEGPELCGYRYTIVFDSFASGIILTSNKVQVTLGSICGLIAMFEIGSDTLVDVLWMFICVESLVR